jgi:ribulose 1,5-bisphosphate carboxylase large subunit-like protein
MIGEDDYIIVECVLRSEVLRYRARGLVREEAEKQVGELVEKVWVQVRRDALIGTYGDYTEALFGHDGADALAGLRQTTELATRIKPEFSAADLDTGTLPFRLELQAKWFKEPRMGLQHLIHVLCGDIFGRAVSDIRGVVEVRSIALGRLGDELQAHYRAGSHDIKQIRALFNLDRTPLLYAVEEEYRSLPLLAFSVKPRNGLAQTDFKRIAEGVLRAGFNIVEADVRNIDFMDATWRATFDDIAKTAVDIKTHVARFSLNLSGPADLAIQYAQKFQTLHPADGPWVVKVDGGLDGISTIQALRTHFAGTREPVITCYPILGDTLARKIGAQTFFEMLSLSGADIIYPGGAPRIGDGDFVDFERAEQGIRRYRAMISRGWPMPSIAGGVHAGQLPAYYEILGPEVAYFLGGGVALHLGGAFFDSTKPKGFFSKNPTKPKLGTPIEATQKVGGAELCRFALEAAASTIDGEKLREMLRSTRDHYVKFVEGQTSSAKYQFVDPKQVLVGSIRSFREKR